MQRSPFILAAALLLTALLAACGERSLPPPQEAGELVVAIREGMTTYVLDDDAAPAGFEHDLAHLFADELGVRARFIVVRGDADVQRLVKNGRAHLGTAWQGTPADPALRAGPAYFASSDVIVQNEATLPIDVAEDLDGRVVDVVAGSRQAEALRELRRQLPEMRANERRQESELALLARIASEADAIALVDRAVLDIASNYYPQLREALVVGKETPIGWILPAADEGGLGERAAAFVERIRGDGTLARLVDRYFGHIDRLDHEMALRFVERIRTVLPKYRALFQAAEAETGIDWRLLAALAYQESHWDPLATSPTNVRGMMMLTEETADRLRVDNRLDPRQSIRAGARYLADLRDALPASTREPDRTWLAIAAYNLGMGHLGAARHIAGTLRRDTDSWYAMKGVLPLLARPEYYQRLKSGRGRGGEAVIMTENVRMYFDILGRYEPAYRPLAARNDSTRR